jgi:hypothetical protein
VPGDAAQHRQANDQRAEFDEDRSEIECRLNGKLLRQAAYCMSIITLALCRRRRLAPRCCWTT